MVTPKKIFLSVFFLLAIFVTSQESLNQNDLLEDFTETEESSTIKKDSVYFTESSLPSGYREVNLKMDLDSVKEELKKDIIFGYKGDRDVSLLSGENRSLIETFGSSFISRAWFQFIEDALYIISLQLDTNRVDYYSMFTAFTKKYGEPTFLDPKKSQWIDDYIVLSLEKPLTVKYIDKEVYDALLESSEVGKDYLNIILKEFIDEF